MSAKFEQNISGTNAKGTQIENMRDNYEGKSITVGLSAEEVTQVFQAIDKLGKEDRQELETHLKQIKEAKTEDEKKSLARKASEFIRERGWGIFDSLVAGGMLLMANGPQ